MAAARQWRKGRAAGLAALALVAVAPPSWAGAPPPGTIVPSLAPLIESIKPAVVTVAVERPLQAERRGSAPLPDGSIGSGVVVHASRGLILTNAAVLEGAAEVLVVTHDERHLPARVLGVDRATDLALLEARADATADGLVEIRFADADELRVGDYVLAIGNHFGIGKSVTAGIVSALGRRGTSGGAYDELIQTDAPVNPGSAGGALFNLRGELVGITLGIVGPVPANTGIGLAVPADVAQSVALQLARFGQVRRGRFGVTAQDVTPAVAQALGLDVRRGALISNVAPFSAAERAGLAHGDVVLAVDGRPVRGATQMRNRVGLVPLGDEATLSVLRGDRMLKLHMHAEAAPPAPAGPDSSSARPRPAARDQIDL